MVEVRMRPSHPLVGWSFVALGTAGLLSNLAVYALRCRGASVPIWPVADESLLILADVVRQTLPGAIVLMLGVLLPLQRLARNRRRIDLLSRTVTGSLLSVVGAYWLLRLNLVGFASLWSRQQPLGDLVLPAALLENRVWSANIMLMFLIAVLSLPLNAFVRRLLAQTGIRRAPWPLWLIGSLWWVGLVAVLLIAGIG
jgi:hypothetical protein